MYPYFKNLKILCWRFLWCSKNACKIGEHDLIREYILIWNKLAICIFWSKNQNKSRCL